MAEALISLILERLVSTRIGQLEEEVTLVFGVKKAVRKLKSNMESIQAVINDAERKQMTENTVRVWVDRLKDVSYDIDDVLDEWSTAILKVEIDRVENPKVCFFIPASCCMFRQLIIRRDIAVKIKHLNGRLDEIAKEKNDYSFQSLTVPTLSKSTAFDDVEAIVGRVDDKKMLIDMLLSESSHGPNVSIISIIGMGGLGKTTLAQYAYNDETIHAHFTKRMWVCVSDPFDEMRVAKAILEALMGSTPNLNELNSLLKSISEHVEGQRFLLVLDDVWCDENDWCKKLQDSLKAGLPGSKILITTRKEGVANKARSEKFYLGKLTDEECWDLFKRVAFYDWKDEEREVVEAIGYQIVEKCKGLPLAVKTIGSFLCMKKLKQEWSNVLGKGEKWRVTEEKGVFSILLLSYNDLPPPIRQCFLYCAVFPKDYKIWKDDIINLWMAQGYLGVDNSIEMEEVGDDYFSELARRSFFQDFKRREDGTIKRCKMHEIVHHFARSLTKLNECLSMKVNGVEERNLETSSYANTRHLMMMFGRRAISIPISLNLKSLRTLIFSGYASFDESFDQVLGQLTNLRTLDLSKTPIEKLPKKVGKLLRLRYLNLEGCEKLKELPNAIWDLCNLLILNIKGCDRLRRLPSGLGKVINLRKLLVWDTAEGFTRSSLPRGVDKLTCIRQLNEFVVVRSDSNSNEASTLSDLMKLNQLRGSLKIHGLANVREESEAKKAKLNEKEHLTELALMYYPNDNRGEEEAEVTTKVINALKPHKKLPSLVLKYMPWPDWMTPDWMTNLKHFVFTSSCEVLPALGNFPFLESLVIISSHRLKRVGFEFLGTSTSFPRLNKLKFQNMREWEDWDYNYTTVVSTQEGSCNISPTTTSIISTMPCLQELRIICCPKLKRLPDHILNQVPSLQRFHISDCPILKEYMIRYFPGDTRPSCLDMSYS